MTDDRLAVWLEQMQTAAELSSSYAEGMDFDAFANDLGTQQAVMLNLLVLGEIAAKLMEMAPALVAAMPQVLG